MPSGGRAGADRTYKSGVKEYICDTETCDLVVGGESIRINGESEINFYFIPTSYIEALGQKSLSINKIPQAKNNGEILLRCKEEDFVTEVFASAVAGEAESIN